MDLKVGLVLLVLGVPFALLTNLLSPDDSQGAAGPQGGEAKPSAVAPLSPAPSASSGGGAHATTRAPEPPPVETAAPTTAAPRDRPPDPLPSDERSTEPAARPRLQYLSTLEPIGGLGNWKRTGSVDMGGRTYGNSIVFASSQSPSKRMTLTYNIPAGMRHFKVAAGLDDRSPDGNAVFFQIDCDGTPVDSGFTLRVGEERSIDLSVAGARRLTIEAEVTLRPFETTNAPLRTVWGDARFTVD
ncbi:NPCBM/NEW2 domain-containing protein [Streptomyces sp. NPDC004050]